MQIEEISIQTEYIAVDKLLKLAGLVESGGQAHEFILGGLVKLDGQLVREKRKKIYPGSVVSLDDQYYLRVITTVI